MENPLKVVLAVATLLTNVFIAGLFVWTVFFSQLAGQPKVLLAVTCALLLPAFSYFSFRDFKTFFGPKPTDSQQ
jgi:positive regulator of sigma E activity